MKLQCAVVTALICASCSSEATSKPSETEIEAAIIYTRQEPGGELLSYETENCQHRVVAESQYYNCTASYRFKSYRFGRVIQNQIGLCLKLKLDGVWRECQASSDYNIVGLNPLTR